MTTKLFLVVCLTFFICYTFADVNLNHSHKFSERVIDCFNEKDTCKHNNKFWIYFTDKGLHMYNLEEYNHLINSIKDSIHPNSLKRRTKHLQSIEEFKLDEFDFPIYNSYISQVTSINNVKLSKTSKWLNSISIITQDIQILKEIEKFSFVKKIDIVASFIRIKDPLPNEINEEKKELKPKDDGSLNYGHSFDQLNVVHVPDLHDLGLTANGVTILIADSGFNLDHPAIKDLNIDEQRDFISEDDDVTDQNSDEIGGKFKKTSFKLFWLLI